MSHRRTIYNDLNQMSIALQFTSVKQLSV